MLIGTHNIINRVTNILLKYEFRQLKNTYKKIPNKLIKIKYCWISYKAENGERKSLMHIILKNKIICTDGINSLD